MVRLGLPAIALLVAACTGEIQSDNLEGLSPEEQVAQTKWVDKALPIFATKCAPACHDGTMPMIGYLAGADDLAKRETLVNYVPRVVNLGAPQSSRVLTKGDHTAGGGGPALLAQEASDILSWIIAEREARPELPVIRTEQIAAMVCTGTPCPLNTVDLTPLGVAATLEFEVSALGADSYFTNIKLKAGAAGLYVEHPLIESWPAGAMAPTPDPVDRFFAIQSNLAPNAELVLGTATIVGFAATDPITFKFDVIEMQRAQ